MRLHIVSDLHPDIDGNAIGDDWNPPEADAVFVAGDLMSPGSHGLRMLRTLYPDKSVPLFVVAGNHDYYSEGDPKKLKIDHSLKTTFEIERERMRDEAAKLRIVYLDNGEHIFDGVRVLGGTLWTDFRARPSYMSLAAATKEVKSFSDFRCVKTGAGRSKDKFTAEDMLREHRITRKFLEEKLAEEFDGDTTIVMTHHAPSYRSLSGWDPEKPHLFGSFDCLFASDLEYLMTGPNALSSAEPPLLWIHGHTHRNEDYVVGKTRVVANQRGYPPEHGHRHRENPKFDPGFVIEIEPRPSLTMRL